jgi:hypothetical protein
VKELRSEIDIDGPPTAVWKVLTDFASFPSWNPFIREAKGVPKVGQRLRVRIHPPGGRAMTFRPRVLVSEENRELRWLGHLLFAGLFDGEHIFKLEPLEGGRTHFIQCEEFNGVLVPLLWGSLDRNARRGFEELNRALKARVEDAR